MVTGQFVLAVRDEGASGSVCERAGEEAQEIKARRVRPVQIVEEDYEGRLSSESERKSCTCWKSIALALLPVRPRRDAQRRRGAMGPSPKVDSVRRVGPTGRRAVSPEIIAAPDEHMCALCLRRLLADGSARAVLPIPASPPISTRLPCPVERGGEVIAQDGLFSLPANEHGRSDAGKLRRIHSVPSPTGTRIRNGDSVTAPSV